MDEKLKRLIKWGVLGVTTFVVALIILPSTFVIVGAGEQGVVLNWGAVQDEVLDEGFHLKVPVMQKIIKMNVKKQKVEVQASAASKDLQVVTTSVALNFHLNPLTVNKLYKEVRNNYGSIIIAPVVMDAIKASTALYTAEELVTKRSEVKASIEKALKTKLESQNLVVDDVNITNFKFSVSFDKAIEAKVTAEQEALVAKNRLEQVKFEAQQQIERARAEAEAIKIQAEAINKGGGKDYVQLQAIAKWNGQLPTSFVPGSALPFLNIK